MDRNRIESKGVGVRFRPAAAGPSRRTWFAVGAALFGLVLTANPAPAQEGGEPGQDPPQEQQADEKAQQPAQESPPAATSDGQDAQVKPRSAGKGGKRRATRKQFQRAAVADGQAGGKQGPIKARRRTSIPTETPTGPVTGAPGIRCPETVKDFGVRWAGPSAKHTFKLANEGDQTLEITSVRPSCGCTVTKNYTKKIPPGGQGEIPVSLRTEKLRGTFTKTITVKSNDPATPQLKLKITGQIKRYVDVAPAQLSFGRVTTDTVKTMTTTLTNNTETPLELTLPDAKIGGPFTAELIEKKPGKVYEVKVQAQPPYDPKLNQVKVALKTNIPRLPTLKIRVTAYLQPRLHLSPESVLLKRSTAKEQTRFLSLRNNGATPVKVLSAETNDEKLVVSVVEQEAGKRYQIQVTVPANYLPPPEGKTVTIRTDDAEFPEMTVPVRGARPRATRTPAVRLLGKVAPPGKFETLDDQSVTLEDLEGKVVVLDFYAGWCSHSRKQVPQLTELYERKYADNPDVRFLAVNQDQIKEPGEQSLDQRARTKEQVVRQYGRLGGAFPVVLDPEGIGAKGYLVSNLPTLVLLGKDGVVQAVHVGGNVDQADQLERQIDLLLAGKTRAAFPPDAPAAPSGPQFAASSNLPAHKATVSSAIPVRKAKLPVPDTKASPVGEPATEEGVPDAAAPSAEAPKGQAPEPEASEGQASKAKPLGKEAPKDEASGAKPTEEEQNPSGGKQ